MNESIGIGFIMPRISPITRNGFYSFECFDSMFKYSFLCHGLRRLQDIDDGIVKGHGFH